MAPCIKRPEGARGTPKALRASARYSGSGERRNHVTRHELCADACSGSSLFASLGSAGKSGLTCETSLYSSRAIMYMRLSSPCTVTL